VYPLLGQLFETGVVGQLLLDLLEHIALDELSRALAQVGVAELAVVLCAWAARPDLLGVTSFVRGSFLAPACYHALLNLFHSSALDLPLLLKLWVKFALTHFSPVKEDGYVVFVADGLKIAKAGKKMPAVKCLHQESQNNSKAEYIMGHSFQVISLLVTAATGQVVAVPLLSRICEGLKRRGSRLSLLDMLASMFLELTRIAGVP
jgi:hypothetical protein